MAKTVTHEDQVSYFGDEDHLQVAQSKSFAQMIFELLSEKEPTPGQLKVFELILNLSIDHGPDTPSAVKVIESAKSGAAISQAVARGIEEINDVHGGAIEPAMRVLESLKSQVSSLKDLVQEYLGTGKRLPGFGHRLYEDQDPRAQLILQKLQEVNLGEEYIKIAKEIETELESQKGKKLPLNIDGAIAVALCSFGWDARLGKAVFIIARTPGLCAHFLNNSNL